MKNPRKKAQDKSARRAEKTRHVNDSGHDHAHEEHTAVYRILPDGSVKQEHTGHPDNS